MAHLVVGAIAVVAFLITGLLMNAHDPPVVAMDWASACCSIRGTSTCARAREPRPRRALRLPEPRPAGAAIVGSLLVLASAAMLFFAFFAEPMAGRWPGLERLGLLRSSAACCCMRS